MFGRPYLKAFTAIALPLTFTHASGPPACYYPSGEQAVSDFACDLSSDDSFCCAVGYTCLANKICYKNQVFNGTTDVSWNRGSCTDKSWTSPDCPQFCENLNVDNGDWVIRCGATGELCCFNSTSPAPADCCSDLDVAFFTLAGAPTAFNTIGNDASTMTRTLTPTSSISSISSTLTGSSDSITASSITSPVVAPQATSSPTNAPSKGSHLSGGVGAGIAIGAVAVLAIVAAAVFFYRRRGRRSPPVQGAVTSVEPYWEKNVDTPASPEVKKPSDALFEVHGERERAELEEGRFSRTELEG